MAVLGTGAIADARPMALAALSPRRSERLDRKELNGLRGTPSALHPHPPGERRLAMVWSEILLNPEAGRPEVRSGCDHVHGIPARSLQ